LIETELARDRYQANPATNSAGDYHLTETVPKQLNNPIHQLQENYGINWIVINPNLAQNFTNSYFEQIITKDGILLRPIEIFTRQENGRPAGLQPQDDLS
jgi:hypothetical protein